MARSNAESRHDARDGSPVTQTHDATDPRFITILGDYDSHARWVARIQNTDTKHVAVDVLIVLAADGTVTVATRPANQSDCTWAPPIDAERR